jgi:O-antigen ligase
VSVSIVAVFALLTFSQTVFQDPLEMSGRIVVTPIVAFVALWFIQPSHDEIRRLLMALAVSCVVLSFLMYVQTGPYQADLNIGSWLIRFRGNGFWVLGRFYEGAPIIGGPAGVAVVAGAYSALNSKGLKKLLFSLTSLAAVAILIFSISRAALVASLAGLIILAGYQMSVRRIIIAGTLVVIGGAALMNVAIEHIPTAAIRYSGMISSNDASLNGRFDLWTAYSQVARQNPIGSGFDYRDVLTTHNEVIGQWVATGIIGLIAYLTFLVYWGLLSLRDSGSLAMLAFFSAIGMAEHYTVSSGTLLFPLFWIISATFIMRSSSLSRPTISLCGRAVGASLRSNWLHLRTSRLLGTKKT